MFFLVKPFISVKHKNIYGGRMGAPHEHVPQPLHRFVDHGLVTRNMIEAYSRYMERSAKQLFYELLSTACRDSWWKCVEMNSEPMLYEKTLVVRPLYDNSLGRYTFLSVIYGVRAYYKSGLYVEALEIITCDGERETHDIEVEVGRK